MASPSVVAVAPCEPGPPLWAGAGGEEEEVDSAASCTGDSWSLAADAAAAAAKAMALKLDAEPNCESDECCPPEGGGEPEVGTAAGLGGPEGSHD